MHSQQNIKILIYSYIQPYNFKWSTLTKVGNIHSSQNLLYLMSEVTVLYHMQNIRNICNSNDEE